MAMTIQEKAQKKVADAYYGEGAAIGDGTFLKMLMEFFSSFLGSCPLGARRAHKMLNGGPLQKRRARAQLEYAAYEWTGGDWEQTQKIVETGLTVGASSTEKEFVEFASAA